MLLVLAGCAGPVAKVATTANDMVYTASGRYPAAHSGILVAQNAALTEGRTVCDKQSRRFRPLVSVAGEDAATGEAVFAVRFRCVPGWTLHATPLPGTDTDTTGTDTTGTLRAPPRENIR